MTPLKSITSVNKNVTGNNPCFVMKCNTQGVCANVDQTGSVCYNTPTDVCNFGVCKAKNCIISHVNESALCNPADSGNTGAGLCQRSICIQGNCTQGGRYWDNTTCTHIAACSVLKCANGNCDGTTIYNSPSGTICGGGGNPCLLLQCDNSGACLSAVVPGTPCSSVSVTYKRANAPDFAVPNECQSYTCANGACTTNIANIDGIPCVGNFSDPCLYGQCLGGVCSPVANLSCNPCGEFTTCSTCLGGSFGNSQVKRDTIPPSTPSVSSGQSKLCRQNPNLPECKLNCSWCGGQCYATEEVSVLNSYFPAGSVNHVTCQGSCPGIFVATDGNDLKTPLGVGLGVGGGLALLGCIAAAAALTAFLVKRKLKTPDSSLAEVNFVNNVAAQDGAVYESKGIVSKNNLYTGAEAK